MSEAHDSHLLDTIQRLQFSDSDRAEALLLSFMRETFPQLNIRALMLRPQAVSLNSFNGFLTLADDSRLFFKTHVEQDNVIGEYYNATMLADAGYPIIQPLYSSTRSGQQLVIYPVVSDPSVFDVARALETGESDPALAAQLAEAQADADRALFTIYARTLEAQSAEDAARSPVHQLFYHRLVGGRLDRFYGLDTEIIVQPGAPPQPLEAIRRAHWVINGRAYDVTLNTLIARATSLLGPAQSGPSVVGHGDAHNGNVFFSSSRGLRYFDPAFAGRHHPLLDLTKPLFHNVFAMWMYFPADEAQRMTIHAALDGEVWQVNHDYTLNPLRLMFLRSKVTHTLIPVLRLLRSRDLLRPDWRAYLKAALFCCPFLTLDLKRFPPEISLLGLCMAVEMGAESPTTQRSIVDTVLDEAEAASESG